MGSCLPSWLAVCCGDGLYPIYDLCKVKEKKKLVVYQHRMESNNNKKGSEKIEACWQPNTR